MGDELSIRQYRPADQDRVLQLHVAAMKGVDAYADREDELDADLEDIESAYLNSGGDFLVGEFDGQIVAIGAFKPPSGYFTHFLSEVSAETAEITRMRVDSDYQDRGFGEKIYDELERRAHASDFEELILDTTHKQEAAQGLYEKKNFREVKRENVEFDGDNFTMIIYKKPL